MKEIKTPLQLQLEAHVILAEYHLEPSESQVIFDFEEMLKSREGLAAPYDNPSDILYKKGTG